jgi:hypothetical protein
MYKYTLQDARNSGALKAISGVCSTTQQFTDYINEAQARLSRRGDFWGMTQTMQLVFQGTQVAWPRAVETVLGIRNCCFGNMSVKNNWYSFTGAWTREVAAYSGNVVFEDINPSPIFQGITGSGVGRLLRYYVVSGNDVGKKITIYGKKYGQQPLQSADPAAPTTLIDGLTLTAARPYVSSSVLVTDIDSITREATEGMAYLYEYDATNDQLIMLAAFEPNDTHPRFRRSVFRNLTYNLNPVNCDIYGTGAKFNGVEVLVKLKCLEVTKPNDFLLIDDFYALKFMIQAIKAEEANDHTTAETLILKAIRELNFIDRNTMPRQMTPVLVNGLSNNRVTYNPN